MFLQCWKLGSPSSELWLWCLWRAFFAAPHLVGEMEGLGSSLRVTPVAMGSTSLGLKIELEL